MVDFYQRMQGIASDVLTRFAQGSISLYLVTPGTGPAHNPGPSTLSAAIPLSGAANPAKGGVLLEPGSLVKVGDLKVTTNVADTARLPTIGDKLDLNGQTYSVIRFDAVPATGTAAAWVFYVRR